VGEADEIFNLRFSAISNEQRERRIIGRTYRPLEATAARRLRSVVDISAGPSSRVYTLEKDFPNGLSRPLFKVVILHKQVDSAANCLVELVKSVTGEEEDAFAVFQSPEKHCHQTITHQILSDSLL
jgi:hypothetical protein